LTPMHRPQPAAYLAVRTRTTGQGSSGHALRRRHRIRPLGHKEFLSR
jgi:hypothetical protein